MLFPSPSDKTAIDQVMAVCFGCPVIEACLAEAMANPELEGIWGGTTEQQRKQARAKSATSTCNGKSKPRRAPAQRRPGGLS
jgi:WhiB family redox-sensing transcriptional regulator